jgi:hypothetical protein
MPIILLNLGNGRRPFSLPRFEVAAPHKSPTRTQVRKLTRERVGKCKFSSRGLE